MVYRRSPRCYRRHSSQRIQWISIRPIRTKPACWSLRQMNRVNRNQSHRFQPFTRTTMISICRPDSSRNRRAAAVLVARRKHLAKSIATNPFHTVCRCDNIRIDYSPRWRWHGHLREKRSKFEKRWNTEWVSQSTRTQPWYVYILRRRADNEITINCSNESNAYKFYNQL